VSEKFFALCDVFGAENVGMLTGDASVNEDAPIICCTAEILANIALREGTRADVGQVVMDEFHFYAEPDRGWAWQVPLIELPQAQFVLMSATLATCRVRGRPHRRTGGPRRCPAPSPVPAALRVRAAADTTSRSCSDQAGAGLHRPLPRLRRWNGRRR
jgi:hypothetical protein